MCDYGNAYILVKWTISTAAPAGDNPNNGDKEAVFKNCAPFTHCLSEANNKIIKNIRKLVAIL